MKGVFGQALIAYRQGTDRYVQDATAIRDFGLSSMEAFFQGLGGTHEAESDSAQGM